MAETRLESMWGAPTLEDDGFSSIPNLLIRKYRKLGMTNGEACFINLLITFRHDERDPYPTRKTLAGYLECSERQITKWIRSLKDKGLLLTEQHGTPFTGKWKKTVFSFKPLLDALAKLVGEKKKSSRQPSIRPQKDVHTNSHDTNAEQKQPERVAPPHPAESIQREPNVSERENLRFQRGGPEVLSKKKRENNNKMIKDHNDDRACAHILKSEFISSQLLNENEFKRIMSRVKEAKPFNLFAYARKALLTAVQRKNEREVLHKEKMATETDRARLSGHKNKKSRFSPQRQAIPVVQPQEGTGSSLSPEELQRARELARRLDAEQERSFSHA